MSDSSHNSWGKMREDRPLDALFPELSAEYEPILASSPEAEAPLLSTQVLEVELEDKWQWALASFKAPARFQDLWSQLGPLLEVTLLQELSRPPGFGGLEGRAFEGATLFAFEAFPAQLEESLREVGWVRLDRYDADHYRQRMSRWQQVATDQGFACPAQPAQIWWMPLHQPDEVLAKKLKFVQVRTAEALGSQVWGQKPGMPSKLMAQHLEQQLPSLKLSPTFAALHELDMLLIERQPRRMRWLPPMLFQGLCDLMAVIAIHELGHRTQWGVSQSDGQGGFYPPLLRLERAKGPQDVELGLQLYRFAIAPYATAEGIEPKAALLVDWLKALLK